MISSQQLGERIADARKNARLTQADVSQKLGVARTTVVAIEKGERRPSNAELVRIAEVLSVSVHALLRQHYVRAEVSPRFRLTLGSSTVAEGVVSAVNRLRSLAQRYAELEQINGIERVVPRLDALQTYRADQVGTLDPRMLADDAASTVRGLLGFGDEPVLDLEERFELDGGLRIFHLDGIPRDLCALLIWSDELGACIGVNADHPHERRRWSLAHEFGHVLRDREAGDVLETATHAKDPAEVFADGFAKSFLMPASGVSRRFADRCRLGGNRFTALDVASLARTYQVSFHTMTLRLEELGLLPRGTYNRLNASGIRPRDLTEADAMLAAPREAPSTFPRRYVSLAVRAHEAGLLSEGELAAMLDVDRVTARQIFQEHERVELDDELQLPLTIAGDDLRA